jgi:hypothetical protein
VLNYLSTTPCGRVGDWRWSSTILTSAPDGGEWSTSRPGRLTSGERALATHWIAYNPSLYRLSHRDSTEVYKALNSRTIDERWIGKDLQASRGVLFEVLSSVFSKGTDGNHENLQSGYPVTQPSFELGTFRIRAEPLRQSVRLSFADVRSDGLLWNERQYFLRLERFPLDSLHQLSPFRMREYNWLKPGDKPVDFTNLAVASSDIFKRRVAWMYP